MIRRFVAVLGALGTWSALGQGDYARAALIVLGVGCAAAVELVAGLVRRRLSTPPASRTVAS